MNKWQILILCVGVAALICISLWLPVLQRSDEGKLSFEYMWITQVNEAIIEDPQIVKLANKELAVEIMAVAMIAASLFVIVAPRSPASDGDDQVADNAIPTSSESAAVPPTPPDNKEQSSNNPAS